MLTFELPPLSAEGGVPIWVGNGFKVGNKLFKVLEYSLNSNGWNDDLAFFQEESAGDQHFIDRASRDHAIFQLKKHLADRENPTILEIGCASGFLLRRIQKEFQHANIIGSDAISVPLYKLADTLPNIPLFQFDIGCCPLPDNSIDAVVILNVLEHIENDSLAVEQIYRILKPGGVVIIEVPANPDLYGVYDQVYKHFRRYSLAGLSATVSQCGFKITNSSHLGFFFYPGFKYVKKKHQYLASAPIEIQQEFVKKNIKDTGENRLFHFLMRAELLMGRYLSYPVGIRCLLSGIK